MRGNCSVDTDPGRGPIVERQIIEPQVRWKELKQQSEEKEERTREKYRNRVSEESRRGKDREYRREAQKQKRGKHGEEKEKTKLDQQQHQISNTGGQITRLASALGKHFLLCII